MGEKKQHMKSEEFKPENAAEVDNSSADTGVTADTGVAAGNGKAAGKAAGSSEAAGKDGAGAVGTAEDVKTLTNELETVKKELEDKSKKCEEYLDKLQRTAAEFDNFKRRSVKEKEALYVDAVSDVIGSLLPVIDNVERALQAISADSTAESLKNGVEMVFRQFGEVLKNVGVEEIKAVNETFDPMLHNAVMHVEDDSLGHSVVVEEFQKGYRYKEKVIRYSMVKVAN